MKCLHPDGFKIGKQHTNTIRGEVGDHDKEYKDLIIISPALQVSVTDLDMHPESQEKLVQYVGKFGTN